MNRQQKFRHEFKYFISYLDSVALKSRLKHVLQLDRHAGADGEYHIRSLYFDDLQNTALYQKQAGILQRKKFRIRIYNLANGPIKLEKKSRIGQFISKESYTLSYDQYRMITNGEFEFLRGYSVPLLNEFYIDLALRGSKPAVIVDYSREAYVSNVNNIRITIDKRLRTSLFKTDLFDRSLTTVDVLERPVHILEVKFDHFLPHYIRNLLQTPANTRFAISKFVICKKLSKLNSWEDN